MTKYQNWSSYVHILRFFLKKDHIMVLIFALHNIDIKTVFCYCCSYASAPIVLRAAL